MNYFLKQIYVGVLLSAISHDAVSQVQSAPRSPEGNAIPVTADNFNRAESDMYWGTIVKDGGFGKFVHYRELYPIDGPTFTREQIGTRKTPSNITQDRNNGGTIYKLSVRLQGTDPRFARQLQRSIYRHSDLSKPDARNASPISASTGRRRLNNNLTSILLISIYMDKGEQFK